MPVKIKERVFYYRWELQSLCASIDLLGVRHAIKTGIDEAYQMVNDLHVTIGMSLAMFPGGENYRAVLLGDSVWILKQLPAGGSLGDHWPQFCGHVFTLANRLWDMEKQIGRPGLRAIISFGRQIVLDDPTLWRQKLVADQTKDWFVFSGPSEAVAKCHEAELKGTRAGFIGNLCWHERLDCPTRFCGTPFGIPHPEAWRDPGLYPGVYDAMREGTQKNVRLDFEPWPPIKGAEA